MRYKIKCRECGKDFYCSGHCASITEPNFFKYRQTYGCYCYQCDKKGTLPDYRESEWLIKCNKGDWLSEWIMKTCSPEDLKGSET